MRNISSSFDPTDYNPREWARLAKKAGMKYAVLTAKHHDGFCLFDSALTDYKATNTKAGTGSGSGISGCIPCGRIKSRALLYTD